MPLAATPPTIDVILPTYNRATLLARALEGYCHQSYPAHKFTVIVADDGSTDGTASVFHRFVNNSPYALKYVRLEHSGPATARNRAITLVTGDRILFSGDDIFPHRDLLLQHALICERHPEVGVLGFVEWSPDLELTDFMRFVAPNGAQFNYGNIKDHLNCGYEMFYGANVSIPAHWVHSERFDETIRSASVEDQEFGYRLEKRGLRLVFNPSAVGFHYHPMTHSSFLERTEEAGKATRYLWHIHPELERKQRPLPAVEMGLLQFALQVVAPLCRLINLHVFWQVTLIISYLRGIRKGLTCSAT